ncbi:class I SAM-dependent methyltransferase [Massilia soli]|uniref:Class I SAM-dependent methyltransferase n=1 Tax=Massilia soli TaxID=2792854 RepID=A0ABS7SKL0_9BURK|nr:class I SAM-dependent methyltransferase [Massilia soli]MBZ2206728.1 class I SAM-dependent methyltransferase [Massilia soli]
MDQLHDIAQRTLAHYQDNAREFFNGTVGHDVSQNIAALLGAIEAPAPYTILDLGCGPGRDLKTLKGMGHRAIGLDGAGRFVEMARDYSGCEVWHQNLLHLELPASMFDGIYANAVLFHVPSQALAHVLKRLFDAIKPGGVLFSSNPRGHNQEGWNGERYGSYHDYDSWARFVTAAGFAPLHHYYRPEGLPRDQQPWLASVWRKPAEC